MGDTLTCAESSKLPNAMDRDHWSFGAGLVFYSEFDGTSPVLIFFFFKSAVQSPHLSGYSRRREGALARNLTLAVGF